MSDKTCLHYGYDEDTKTCDLSSTFVDEEVEFALGGTTIPVSTQICKGVAKENYYQYSSLITLLISTRTQANTELYNAVSPNDSPVYSPSIHKMTYFFMNPNIIEEEFFHDDIGCERYDEETKAQNYWIGPQWGDFDAYFIVDLGGCMKISKVVLKNSFNIWGIR